MEKQTEKPEMYNSYNCEETIVNVNEYSTITMELVRQMVEQNFSLKYNCIKVELISDSEHITKDTEDFVKFFKEKFSVVLIQKAGYDKALINLFTQKDLTWIDDQLFNYEINKRWGLKIKY